MKLSLIGIGCGNPDHLTIEAIAALNRADLILLPDKGEEKAALAHLRAKLLARHLTRTVPQRSFAMPKRRKDQGYLAGVNDWHDEIAACWLSEIAQAGHPEHVALLVWGDPSLYDSTLRIAARISPAPEIRVVPGITSLSMLTAAHRIPLNGLGDAVAILPARVLREKGWPEGIATLAVFLDDGSTLADQPEDCLIWWGAYLGMEEEALIAGRLGDLRDEIATTRAALRAQHGWIMDLYLLRRP
ncbi:precorrin-6A synthase (deacetylating) [Paracoccus aminophilus]|uniref:Precorrin-6A synthase [deacetylating] n=1 Tax=Paracoccus aminophilus JCM 7686 TaxID=1367847 RepID=S5XXW0_PARAH|nr:precorrin-6A synthase (deacetylating) [Paracoccus aminophilus]AGT08285.1 precorrin-6A synthase (deacetylating) [Paracoccus aminophilus JCM 7686]